MLLVSSSRVSSSYVQAVNAVALERQWDTQCNRCESTVWPIILWSCTHPASLCSSSSVCTYLALQQLWLVCFGVTAWILWGLQSGENLVRLMTTPCCADIQWDILRMQSRKQWCLSGMTVNKVLNSLSGCISLSRLSLTVICATFSDPPEVFDFSMCYLLRIDTQLHMSPPKWLYTGLSRQPDRSDFDSEILLIHKFHYQSASFTDKEERWGWETTAPSFSEKPQNSCKRQSALAPW